MILLKGVWGWFGATSNVSCAGFALEDRRLISTRVTRAHQKHQVRRQRRDRIMNRFLLMHKRFVWPVIISTVLACKSQTKGSVSLLLASVPSVWFIFVTVHVRPSCWCLPGCVPVSWWRAGGFYHNKCVSCSTAPSLKDPAKKSPGRHQKSTGKTKQIHGLVTSGMCIKNVDYVLNCPEYKGRRTVWRLLWIHHVAE